MIHAIAARTGAITIAAKGFTAMHAPTATTRTTATTDRITHFVLRIPYWVLQVPWASLSADRE